MSAMTLVLIALLLGALALLAAGLRGRRVDDHPLCRRCGFDLTGRPESSTRCAECGAELIRPRAVRVGHRRRQRGALASGTVLFLVAGAPLALVGWGRARGVDWNRHKPARWLMGDAKGGDSAARDAALKELLARIAAGTLPEPYVVVLTQRALAEQGEGFEPWVPAWGRVVELARESGKLPDGAWRQYQRRVIRPEIRLGHRRRMLDPFRAVLTCRHNRVGTGGRFRVTFTAPRLVIDGVTLPLGDGDAIVDVVGLPGGDTVAFSGSLTDARAAIAAGFEHARFEVDVTVEDGPGSEPVTQTAVKELSPESFVAGGFAGK